MLIYLGRNQTATCVLANRNKRMCLILMHESAPPWAENCRNARGAFCSFQSQAKSFSRFFHRFAQIYALITISLLDIRFKWCFMIFFFCFEGVLLAMRGCTYSLRGCSRSLKPLIFHPCAPFSTKHPVTEPLLPLGQHIYVDYV